MAMGKTNNTEFLNGLFEGGNFPNAQIIVMTGDGVHISYESPVRKAKGEPEPASKDAIMEYVKKLTPIVREEYQGVYSEMWLGILELKEVKSRVYNKGKQQGTTFNRDFVAQIIHQLGNRIYLPDANPVVMAEHLEPEKGKDHPVRQKLGESPDKSIKKAIEAFLRAKVTGTFAPILILKPVHPIIARFRASRLLQTAPCAA